MTDFLDRHGGRAIEIQESDCLLTGGSVETFVVEALSDPDVSIEVSFGDDAAYFNIIVDGGESVFDFSLPSADAERFAQAVLIMSRRAVMKPGA